MTIIKSIALGRNSGNAICFNTAVGDWGYATIINGLASSTYLGTPKLQQKQCNPTVAQLQFTQSSHRILTRNFNIAHKITLRTSITFLERQCSCRVLWNKEINWAIKYYSVELTGHPVTLHSNAFSLYLQTLKKMFRESHSSKHHRSHCVI